MPPNDQGHRGGPRPPASRDRRITELTDASKGHNLIGQSGKQFASDPFRGMSLELLSHTFGAPMRVGVIVYSLPYANWYKVQLNGSAGTVGCRCGGISGFGPAGPREATTIPPYTEVIVWLPPGHTTGVILCAVPNAHNDGTLVCPDFVSQGSQSGIKREKAYKDPFTQLYRNGGIDDYSGGRPLDQTIMDRGWVTETGLAILLDPYMAQMRVNEQCGIWLHYHDSHMRVAGWNLDLQTASHEVVARADEGENLYEESHNVYPWETIGLYGKEGDVHEEFSAEDVQMKKAKGAYDLSDENEDVQSVARYEEYGGYLGQGRLRIVNVPAKESGVRHYKDDPTTTPDMGVFMEAIGLDGSYALTSAKQINIVKRTLIPVPKRMRLPEDQHEGDDARKGNYNFSGANEGPPHEVGDVQVEGEHQQILRTAAVDDLLAYAFNWQPLHPFHYHQGDHKVPQEADIQKKAGAPEKLQDSIDFGQLAGQTYLNDPDPRRVRVDHRYAEVDYYQRMSGISFLPDGGVALYSGDGVRLVLAGGRLKVEAPGGIDVCPGGSFNVLAGDDINLRARNSFDASAGLKDARIKGQRNVQITSVDAGILIESKASGFIADYENKIGEDVVSGGIVLQAKDSAVVSWGGEIYTRSTKGKIVIDAQKAGSDVVLKGNTIDEFATSAVNLWVGPRDENNNVTATFNFNPGGALLDKGVRVDGTAIFTGGVINGEGMINMTGYACVSGWPFVGGPIPAAVIQAAIKAVKQEVKAQTKAGEEFHKSVFPSDLYKPKRPGNDKVIDDAEFSFRDDEGRQYNATQFKIAEGRWQQMVRLGLGSGGKNWDDEPLLSYQGKELLPYPGKTKWIDEPTLLRLEANTMFDTPQGRDTDRPGEYEEPKLSQWDPVAPASGFRIISD